MSSGSDSDDEFVPGEPEQLSEEESADDETELQYEKELEHKTKKRKAAQESNSQKKRRTTRRGKKDPTPEPDEKDKLPEKKLNPEEDKKREEDLWALFLDGTDTKSKKSASIVTPNVSKPIKPAEGKSKAQTSKASNEGDKAREKRIFEFAGEAIVVENNVIKEKVKLADNPVTASKLTSTVSRSRGSGLSDVLGQLNKKTTLSTLEKSKLDWDTYKKEQDIDDEIQSHNKGKSGYLDRQDFLQRADLRQYEIERDLRMSRRSNR